MDKQVPIGCCLTLLLLNIAVFSVPVDWLLKEVILDGRLRCALEAKLGDARHSRTFLWSIERATPPASIISWIFLYLWLVTWSLILRSLTTRFLCISLESLKVAVTYKLINKYTTVFFFLPAVRMSKGPPCQPNYTCTIFYRRRRSPHLRWCRASWICSWSFCFNFSISSITCMLIKLQNIWQ